MPDAKFRAPGSVIPSTRPKRIVGGLVLLQTSLLCILPLGASYWEGLATTLSVFFHGVILASSICGAISILLVAHFVADQRERWFGLTALTVFLAHCVFLIIAVCNSPLQAWDAVYAEWGRNSYGDGAGIIEGALRQDGLYVYEHNSRHGPFAESFLAACAIAGIPIGLPWFFAMLLGVKLLWLQEHNVRAVNVIFTLVLMSLPLLQNHVILFGYSELFQAVFLAIAVHFIAVWLERRRHMDLLIGGLATIASSSVKAYGFIFPILIISTLFLVVVQASQVGKKTKTYTAIGFALSAFLYSVLVQLGWDLPITFSLAAQELEVSSRVLKLNFAQGATAAVDNISEAIVGNLSFSILFPVFYVYSLWYLKCYLADRHAGESTPHLLMTNVFCHLLLTLVFASQFFDYGLAIAGQGSDTGFSRLLITPAVLVLFAMNKTLGHYAYKHYFKKSF